MKKDNYHYYAATCFGWAVAGTRKEAIAKVARDAGRDTIKRQVKSFEGLYVWTAKVLAPIETDYKIRNWQPVGVEIEDAEEARIVDTKGNVIKLID